MTHDMSALTAARDWAAEHVHPQPDDRMLRAYGAELLRDIAALIDRGPAIPLPPSIFSALVRERADDLTITLGPQLPVRHASPGCACGVNGIWQRYVDPICRPLTTSTEEAGRG